MIFSFTAISRRLRHAYIAAMPRRRDACRRRHIRAAFHAASLPGFLRVDFLFCHATLSCCSAFHCQLRCLLYATCRARCFISDLSLPRCLLIAALFRLPMSLLLFSLRLSCAAVLHAFDAYRAAAATFSLHFLPMPLLRVTLIAMFAACPLQRKHTPRCFASQARLAELAASWQRLEWERTLPAASPAAAVSAVAFTKTRCRPPARRPSAAY